MHDEVGTELERPLTQGSGERVVDRDRGAGLRAARAMASMSAICRPGLVGDSIQTSAALSAADDHCGGVLDVDQTELDLAAAGALVQLADRAVVGVSRSHDGSLAGTRSNSAVVAAMPDPKARRSSALECSEHRLEGVPGGVAVPSVLRRTSRHQCAGECDRCVERTPGHAVRPSRADRDGRGRKIVSVHEDIMP